MSTAGRKEDRIEAFRLSRSRSRALGVEDVCNEELPFKT